MSAFVQQSPWQGEKKRRMSLPLLRWIGCAVGLVFGVAGIAKAIAPGQTAASVAAYAILPNVLVEPVAALVSLTEILMGGWLVSGRRPGWAWFCSGMLLALFAVAQILVVLSGAHVSCGCFPGLHEDIVSWGSFARLVVASIVCLAVGSRLQTTRSEKETHNWRNTV